MTVHASFLEKMSNVAHRPARAVAATAEAAAAAAAGAGNSRPARVWSSSLRDQRARSCA